MLVLSRKIGESINIGEGIQVKVIEVREGRVRLGFSAPLEVNIRRQELAPAGGGRLALCREACAVDVL
jgi:carbon storage regulator